MIQVRLYVQQSDLDIVIQFLQISAYGVLSFRQGFYSCCERFFPRDFDILIAPFWDDIYIYDSGEIYYRYSTDSELLAGVGETVQNAFASDFDPDFLFIATWDLVMRCCGSYEVSYGICF